MRGMKAEHVKGPLQRYASPENKVKNVKIHNNIITYIGIPCDINLIKQGIHIHVCNVPHRFTIRVRNYNTL